MLLISTRSTRCSGSSSQPIASSAPSGACSTTSKAAAIGAWVPVSVSTPAKRGRQTRWNASSVRASAPEPRQHLRDVRRGGLARELRRRPAPRRAGAAGRRSRRRPRRPPRGSRRASTCRRSRSPARRQDVVALEMRDLDLAQRQILGRVGDERRSRGQRHRPALGEEAAGVRRGDDLDEAVALGGGGR